MAERLLMIDDDVALTRMVGEYLGARGLPVTAAHGVAEGERLLRSEVFDALILDAMLPDGDGFELCRRLRERSRLPVIMLTARGEEVDRIVGLELGRMTICPSLSARASCWLVCAPCCVAPRAGRRWRVAISCSLVACCLTRGPWRHAWTGGSVTSPHTSFHCCGHSPVMPAGYSAARPCWSWHAATRWRPLTAPSMYMSRASALPSRMIRKSRAASSRCVAQAMCLPSARMKTHEDIPALPPL